jgi:hypothetical protein
VVLGLTEWSPSGQPPTVYDMSNPASWGVLEADYAHPTASEPLRRIFEIAREHGVVCIVKEPRYIDADWRSQLARFYNSAFRRFPSVCHRLHFFTRPVDRDVKDLSSMQDAYRGYTILRPLPVAPVGRTMIAAPPALADAVRCEGDQDVHIFGWPFTIRAMPFISQDTQLLRCAHAALWMVLRHASLVHDQPQRLPGEIFDAALGGVVIGRQLPSEGLSSHQLLSAMFAMGLSPTGKRLPQSAEDEQAAGVLRLYGMICRYINSRLPPVVISKSHAWVLVAYKRTASAGNSVIQLWRHDDARGPYLPIDDPWNEPEPAHRPWVAAYLPLLPKAYLDAERAETVGRSWVDGFRQSDLVAGTTLATAAARPDSLEQATLRTFLVESWRFKQGLVARGMPTNLATAYRTAPMSRYVWVIEIVDRLARSQGQSDVIGEVVLDATLTQFEPLDDFTSMLALHVDDFAYMPGVDGANALTLTPPAGVLYRTGCPPLA